MNRIDIISMALKNLFRRKTRTFLTTLGITIGTISILLTVSLGFGIKKNMENQLKSFGSMNLIEVRPNYENMRAMGGNNKKNEEPKITDKDIEKLKKIDGVGKVSPTLEMQGTLVSGRYIAQYVQISGIDPDFMKEMSPTISNGRMLKKGDTDVIVMGEGILYNFRDKNSLQSDNFGGMMGANGERPKPKVNPMKDKIMITLDPEYGTKKNTMNIPNDMNNVNNSPEINFKPIKIKNVGLLSEYSMMGYSVYMPIEKLKDIKKDYDRQLKKQGIPQESGSNRESGYQKVSVKVEDMNKSDKIMDEIKSIGLNPSGLVDAMKESKKSMMVIQIILGGIGAVALLVAAIGITNTMIMAIYERRREIGIMKVIGASIKDIKKLFLLEASMIGFIGGVVGLTLSLIFSKLINNIANAKLGASMGPNTGEVVLSYIPLWLIGASVGFTVLIGLLSGYLPARKAMKLSALEAIKTE